MTRKKTTSNLDDILGLDSADLSQTNNDFDLASNGEDTLITSETKKPAKKWSENAQKRLIATSIIAGIPSILFVLLFGSMFDLKQALEESKNESAKTVEVKLEADLETNIEENLRGLNAVGDQLRAIKSIEDRKAEPTPEIKLEPKTVAKVEVPPAPAASPVPPASTVTRRRTHVATPRPQPKVVKPVPSVPEFDSMEDWNQLALLGSYGNGQAKANNPEKSGIKSVRKRLYEPTTPAVKLVNNVRIEGVEIEPERSQIALNEAERQFLQALEQKEEVVPPVTTPTGVNIAIAQQVKGKTISGLNWPEGVKSQPQRSFVRLEEPLYDRSNREAISEGAMIVFDISQVQNGIVVGQAVAIIEEGKERPIPPGAIAVLNKKGDLLTAKYKQIKNGSGNSDILSFALGAARQTNELVNRPDSSFSQISSFGESRGTNYGDKNYPSSILSGGATEVIEGRTRELERQRSNVPVSSYWQLKKGTDVLIQVNNSFNY